MLAGLRDGKLEMSRVEYSNLLEKTTKVIHETTGQGTVRHFFFAAQSGSPIPQLDTRLRVFTDGKTTPDIDVDFGTLFVAHNRHLITDNETDGGKWGNDMVQTDSNNGFWMVGYNLAIDIPFHDGIRIELYNPTNLAFSPLWTQVFFDREVPEPVTLKSFGRTYANRLALAANATATLLTIPEGKSGWLVGYFISGYSATGPSWLERDTSIFVDGETAASIRTTGMEDTFLGAFYYQGRQRISSPWYTVGVNRNGACSQAIDWRKFGGIRFRNGAKVVLDTEGVCRDAHEMSYAFLYYEEI